MPLPGLAELIEARYRSTTISRSSEPGRAAGGIPPEPARTRSVNAVMIETQDLRPDGGSLHDHLEALAMRLVLKGVVGEPAPTEEYAVALAGIGREADAS